MTSITVHLAQLRHAYAKLKAGQVIKQEELADGLIAPAIRALERIEADYMALPPMPETVDRRPYDEETYPGYLEGDRDWAEHNSEAVEWLADNHAAIRAAISK
ncbi:hypothetical protein EVC20_105 [Rhizobium phage RHph_Y2_17_1]|nr:hypothetical protein EVC19_105 [Rhizobium phage RHph_Y2_11]QIG75844.1 hypothetical protein EVC20_105 [Rhizobium phage RHph_Y2_17_1]